MGFAERYGKWRRSEAVRGWLMVSPTALFALAMLAVPLSAIVFLSFGTQTGVGSIDWTATLNNYCVAVSEEIYRSLLLRSLWISLAVTAATVIAAFPVAYFVSFAVPASRKSLW